MPPDINHWKYSLSKEKGLWTVVETYHDHEGNILGSTGPITLDEFESKKDAIDTLKMMLKDCS